MFPGGVSVPKPLSQIQRSTRWLLQGLSPRTSFGGFGFSDKLTDVAIITMTGVPQPPPNVAFEGWFVSDDGSRKVSTGILRRDAAGNIKQSFILTEAPTVTFTAADTPEGPRFRGPDTIPAGLAPLAFLRLLEGKTLEDAVALLLAEGPGGELPPWLKFAGVPGPILPGASITATMNLVEGNYAVVNPFAEGMVKSVTVTAPAGPATAEPEADLTIDISDAGYSLSAPITKGTHTIRVNNSASQPRDTLIAQLLGASPTEFLTPFAAFTPEAPRPPPPGFPLGALAPIEPGEHAYFTLDFNPGDYIVFSGLDTIQVPPVFTFQAFAVQAEPTGLGGNEVTYTVLDTPTGHEFSGPDSVEAGWTTFRLHNTESRAEHHIAIIQLLEGKTVQDFIALLEAGPTEGPLPSWAKFAGGPEFVLPGASAIATVNLSEGNYVLVCFISDEDGVPHAAKGLLQALTVTAPSGAPAPEPVVDLTIDMSESGIEISGPIMAGTHTIRVNNVGSQQRALITARLLPGVSPETFLASFESPGPPPGIPIGGLTAIPPGDHAFFTADFAPGIHVLFSFSPDAPPGPPQFVTKALTVDGETTGENLFANFDKFVVTIEPVPDLDPLPSAVVALIHQIPKGGLAHIRHLSYSWTGNPAYKGGFHAGTPKGIVVGLREQTWAALVHARLSINSSDLAGVRQHACHVVNIVEGTGDGKGANFDASCGNPGDGFGVLSYATDTTKHAGFACQCGIGRCGDSGPPKRGNRCSGQGSDLGWAGARPSAAGPGHHRRDGGQDIHSERGGPPDQGSRCWQDCPM